MSTPEETDNRIKIFAAVLAIIQGFTWIILSIMCIVYYSQSKVIEIESYMDFVDYLIYKFYLTSSERAFSDQTVTGGFLYAFAFIYLFLSLIWVCLSALVIKSSWRKLLTWWSEITIVICALDLVLVLMIGLDYSKCLDYISRPNIIANPDDPILTVALGGVCANGILPVMVIIGRGFVLWAFNLFFAIVIGRMGKRKKIFPCGF